MHNFLTSLINDERGVSALEYAILAGLIVGVVVSALGIFGTGLDAAFTALTTKLTTAISAA